MDDTTLGRVVLGLDGLRTGAGWLWCGICRWRAARRGCTGQQLWRCDEPVCARRTWTERRDDVARPRRSLTERARAEVCRRVARGESVAAVALAFGCVWHTAMGAVRDHGQPLVDDPARTASVRVDPYRG